MTFYECNWLFHVFSRCGLKLQKYASNSLLQHIQRCLHVIFERMLLLYFRHFNVTCCHSVFAWVQSHIAA